MATKHAETSEQSDIENYIPGMPSMSDTPGRVERLWNSLFSRSQPIYVRVRR